MRKLKLQGNSERMKLPLCIGKKAIKRRIRNDEPKPKETNYIPSFFLKFLEDYGQGIHVCLKVTNTGWNKEVFNHDAEGSP